MKASNLALRLEDEPLELTEAPRLTRAVIGLEANESPFRRPKLSLLFRDRHLEGRANGLTDQGLRLFRVR